MQQPDERDKTIATMTVPCSGRIVSFGYRPAAWVLIRTESGETVLVGAQPLDTRAHAREGGPSAQLGG